MARLVNAAESWSAVYTAFAQVNFSAFDYNTVKQSLLAYVQLYFPEDFNDYIESSEFVAILELFSYMAELLAYRSDMNAHENFMSTASRKESVLRLANFISYTPTRNLPARGLVKITSVSTTESVYDSFGNNLANIKITWNDPSNVNWREQFMLVMNSILSQPFGTVLPSDRVQVGDVLLELYTLSNTPLTQTSGVPVLPYTATVQGTGYPMELVSSTLTSNGPVEKRPENNTEFTIMYANDGLGDASMTTGFLIYTKQGTLQSTTATFDGVTPNQTYSINVNNINDTDIWVNNINPNTGATLTINPLPTAVTSVSPGYSTIYGHWYQVSTNASQNIIFNTDVNRHKYEVETDANDQVTLVFGDGEMVDIPQGTFQIWYRTSSNSNTPIPSSAVSNQSSSLTYVDLTNTTQTFTFSFSLTSSLLNGSASETLTHIQDTAPNVYATQDRMVNAQDYNTYLLQDPSILKLAAFNRTFAGDSKYIAWHDPTGTYENVKIFGDDLALYYQNVTPPNGRMEIVNTPISAEQLVLNNLQPLLSSTDFFTTLAPIYSAEGLDPATMRTQFTSAEITSFIQTLNGSSSSTNQTFYLYYCPSQDMWEMSTTPNVSNTTINILGGTTYTDASTAGTTHPFVLTAVTNAQNPSYSWTTTAGTLSSTTGPTVTLTLATSVGSSQTATVSCTVNNAYTNITKCTVQNSAAIGVTVTGGTTITGSASSGTTGTFTLFASTDAPSPVYSWSTNLGTLSSTTGPSVNLTLPASAGATATATVTCTVNGVYAGSTVCTTVNNYVPIGLSITGGGSQIGAASTGTTGTFTLTADATNEPNPSFTWSTTAGTLSSTTGQIVTLTLPTNVQTSTTATVTCNVSGTNGTASAITSCTVTNDYATVSIVGGGTVTGGLSTGTTGTFALQASTNIPSPTYTWATTAGTLSSTTGQNVTLTLSASADSSSTASVTCTVNGIASSSAEASTVCTTSNQYVNASISGGGTITGSSNTGTTGTFTLSASTNDPSPSYSWSTTAGSLSSTSGQSVTLSLPASADATVQATVTCTVNGSYGSTSTTATCTTINDALSITGGGTVNGAASTGTVGSFTLSAITNTSGGTPVYSWSTTAGTLSATSGQSVTLTLPTAVDTTTSATVTCVVNGVTDSVTCTTTNSYTASSGGGGCFSGCTRILTDQGYVRFDQLPTQFKIINHEGTFDAQLLVHENNTEPLRKMGNHFVTETHPIKVGNRWVMAKDIFHELVEMAPRTVYNMHVITNNDNARHYLLENGLTAHNIKVSGGGCFSGCTRILTDQGYVRFDQLPMEFNVINHTGTHKATLLVHENNIEPLRKMGEYFVTETHPIKVGNMWIPAKDIFHEPVNMGPRTVYNLHVESDDSNSHHYLLENGLTVHNLKS